MTTRGRKLWSMLLRRQPSPGRLEFLANRHSWPWSKKQKTLQKRPRGKRWEASTTWVYRTRLFGAALPARASTWTTHSWNQIWCPVKGWITADKLWSAARLGSKLQTLSSIYQSLHLLKWNLSWSLLCRRIMHEPLSPPAQKTNSIYGLLPSLNWGYDKRSVAWPSFFEVPWRIILILLDRERN